MTRFPNGDNPFPADTLPNGHDANASQPPPLFGAPFGAHFNQAASASPMDGSPRIDLGTSGSPTFATARVNYTLRAIVRYLVLQAALQIGPGGVSQVPERLVDAGHFLQALAWDACCVCVQQAGHVQDVELLHLLAAEILEATPGFAERVEEAELHEFVDFLYEGTPPDEAAGRQAVAELLQHYLVDRVEADAWAEWQQFGGDSPRTSRADIQEIQEQIDAFRAGSDRRGPFTTAEFRGRIRDRVEIISGVLVAGQLGLLGAATKTLKTLIALDAAMAIATGTAWLGYQSWAATQPRRVGFFSAESGADTLLRKHDVIAAAKRNPLSSEDRARFDALLAENVVWDDRVPDLADAASIAQFRRAIVQHNLAVVFVDPLSMAIGSAGKDLANMAVAGQVILRAAQVCRDAGCTLILIHHTAGDRLRHAGGQGRQPLELADIAYPAVTNHARQWITLARAEPYDEQSRRSVLWLRAGGSGLQAGGTFRVAVTEGYNHDRWDVQVETEGQSIESDQTHRDYEQRREEHALGQRVLDYLGQHPRSTLNSMTRDQDELSGLGRDRLERILQGLLRRGLVRFEPGSGDSRHWYRVAPGRPAGAGEQEHGDGDDHADDE